MVNCMPGMTMPGCNGGSQGSSLSDLVTGGPASLAPGVRAAMLVVLGLALLGLMLFLWRLVRRRQIAGYDWVTDWLGHGGAHAVGMILMVTLVLGWLPSIGPAWVYLTGYAGLALLFGARVVAARDPSSRTDDLWHVFAQLSMVYMFGMLWVGPVVVLTAAFLVLYVALTVDRVLRAVREAGPDAALRSDRRHAGVAGTIGHLAISGSMMAMFVVMQWPAALGGTA
jgi:Domain of unknown function (DUF5134)